MIFRTVLTILAIAFAGPAAASDALLTSLPFDDAHSPSIVRDSRGFSIVMLDGSNVGIVLGGVDYSGAARETKRLAIGSGREKRSVQLWQGSDDATVLLTWQEWDWSRGRRTVHVYGVVVSVDGEVRSQVAYIGTGFGGARERAAWDGAGWRVVVQSAEWIGSKAHQVSTSGVGTAAPPASGADDIACDSIHCVAVSVAPNGAQFEIRATADGNSESVRIADAAAGAAAIAWNGETYVSAWRDENNEIRAALLDRAGRRLMPSGSEALLVIDDSVEGSLEIFPLSGGRAAVFERSTYAEESTTIAIVHRDATTRLITFPFAFSNGDLAAAGNMLAFAYEREGRVMVTLHQMESRRRIAAH